MNKEQIKAINDAMSFLTGAESMPVNTIKELAPRLIEALKSSKVAMDVVEHFETLVDMAIYYSEATDEDIPW